VPGEWCKISPHRLRPSGPDCHLTGTLAAPFAAAACSSRALATKGSIADSGRHQFDGAAQYRRAAASNFNCNDKLGPGEETSAGEKVAELLKTGSSRDTGGNHLYKPLELGAWEVVDSTLCFAADFSGLSAAALPSADALARLF
jgi:hypothetical protein